MSKKRSAATKKSRPAPKAKGAAKRSRGALAAAANPRAPMRKRIAALTSLPLTEADSSKQFEGLMNLLRDKSQPIQLRLKALQALGAARFASPDFAASQGDYIATLRDVATDPNPELRQRVLGIL